jgi:selenocysteine-specific translation elongation factor
VACDDGVMAQTREHLAILQLTGNPQLTVALTKADRVDDARVSEVREAVQATCRSMVLPMRRFLSPWRQKARYRRTSPPLAAAFVA